MSDQIGQEKFTRTVSYLMRETFVQVQGIYLDKGTSLFETLGGITAVDASKPVGGRCATLAAQVAHVAFYLDVMEQYMVGAPPQNVDWGEIWRTVGAVTPAEWQAIQDQLRLAYERVQATMQSFDSWDDDNRLGGALAMIVHTAYHLGEIRQALCTLQP